MIKSYTKKIKDIFNEPNLKYYLTKVDLGNAFDNSAFDVLKTLCSESEDPDFEFLNPEIEKLKAKLISNIEHFNSYKAVNTFRTPDGTQAVRAWFNNYDWYTEKEMKEVDEFNKLATDIWDSYCELVKAWRNIYKE